MVVSSFAIGALATPVFYLGFVDSIRQSCHPYLCQNAANSEYSLVTILFVNILGILPVCFFSTFGSAFGLRQMVLSRYYFGFYGVKIGAYCRLFYQKIN